MRAPGPEGGQNETPGFQGLPALQQLRTTFNSTLLSSLSLICINTFLRYF